MNDWNKLHPMLRALITPGVGASDSGTTREEDTQQMCATVHDDLASLMQIAIREDDSDETKKARKTIQTLALLLDGESGILNYLAQLCKKARDGEAI